MMHRIRRSRRLVIALVMVGLLATGAQLASATPPAAATLVAPSGVIPNGSVTFTWQAADGATFYYLQVNDATASPRFTLWYPAGMACPANSATCSVALTTGWGAGSATWWIQTWNPDGFGSWSVGMRFTVAHAMPTWGHVLATAAERFQLVLGGLAVLDLETGLVWERTPSTTVADWRFKVDSCLQRVVGTRGGWRLPTIDEATSLMGYAGVPAGHPFGTLSSYYWSATADAFGGTHAWIFNPGNGSAITGHKVNETWRAWCVRGGVPGSFGGP